jgi:hypothetical protein
MGESEAVLYNVEECQDAFSFLENYQDNRRASARYKRQLSAGAKIV